MAIKKIYYNGEVFEPLTPDTNQQAAIDSGITETKVTTYDGYQDQIDGKQDELNRTIKLTGDVTGTVTDKGGNLEIATSQTDNTLQEVLTAGSTTDKSAVFQKDANTTTIGVDSIKVESTDGRAVYNTPGQIHLKSNTSHLKFNLGNGFEVDASDGIAEAFLEWLGGIPTTDDISGVGYFADKNTASAAPQGILAFYPESI